MLLSCLIFPIDGVTLVRVSTCWCYYNCVLLKDKKRFSTIAQLLATLITRPSVAGAFLKTPLESII